jgi:hypothetical protein
MNINRLLMILIAYIAIKYLFNNINWSTEWNITEKFGQEKKTNSMNEQKKKKNVRFTKVKENFNIRITNENDENENKIFTKGRRGTEDESGYDSSVENKKDLLRHINSLQTNPINRNNETLTRNPNVPHPDYGYSQRSNQNKTQENMISPMPSMDGLQNKHPYTQPSNQDLMAQNLHTEGPLPLGMTDNNLEDSLEGLETFNGGAVSMNNSGVRVEPVNYYMSDEGSSNFMSNVMDNRQFFRVNSQENVERDLHLGNGITNKRENFGLPKSTQSPQKQTDRNVSLAIPNYHNPPTEWYYNNELVMNGGKFGDITGYNVDDVDNTYESYSIAKPNSDVLRYNYDQFTPQRNMSDDLRMGMGKTAVPIRRTT